MRLDRLIAASHSPDAARAFRAYAPGAVEKDHLASVGGTVLRDFLPLPGACTLLSAVYATRLRSVIDGPVHVVAGDLSADGVRVFGNGQPIDRAIFSQTNLSWDGHVWVMLGGYVADVSLFRTARSKGSPPALAALVSREFGPHTGLVVVKWRDAPLSGLAYSPRYVLTDEQIATLDRSACAVLPMAGQS